MKNYIGVDLGKQSSYFVIKDENGKLLQSSKVFNDRTAIEAALKPYQKNKYLGSVSMRTQRGHEYNYCLLITQVTENERFKRCKV